MTNHVSILGLVFMNIVARYFFETYYALLARMEGKEVVQ